MPPIERAARAILRRVARRALLLIAAPTLFMALASVLALLFLPHPVPRNASEPARIWLRNCATCHGADGSGSWRAKLFLMRPGDLRDPARLAPLGDDYLLTLIQQGGASLGKPGMPAFGYHLTPEQIRELVRYVRELPARSAPRR